MGDFNIINIVMKKSKTIVLSGLIFAVLIIGYIFFAAHWSVDAKKGKANILNSRRIKSQMSQEDILSIIGKPDTIIKKRFCYITNNDSYPYIEFHFDSLRRVKVIYSPKS
ncbi:hypothetical protein [Flavobacterium luteum]|uniref:Outer membrane protein assembly factor BamE n=1 Tax=Flavobacterium luteum TaxID=2026654 RepID=A0A7J5AEY7_9FLAO|nr:hypothetical protein [Flavobacterium luteum]KAB1156157.1 hypothetical protein F6464_08130 [Flavobacterium luteum]